jgi:feruloyl esterase
VISSDAGHTSSSLFGGALFGRDPQARINYGYRANQVLTPIAKKIVSEFYQSPIQHAYFMGCSNGGRHAMVAASRLATEFDGFIAGNPGFNLPKAAVQHAWDVQTLSALNTDLAHSLSQTDLNVLSQGILKACDTLDGVEDDMVQAVSQCQRNFQISTLACDDDQTENCLSANKIAAIEKLFNGPVNSRGEPLYSDWPYDVGVNGADWQRWKITSPIANLPMIATLGAGSLAEIFITPPASIEPSPQNFVNFLREFDFDKDAAKVFATTDTYTQSAVEFMTPPLVEQLSDLAKEGGKLLVYHGASDGVFSVNDTINWYQQLNQNHDNRARDFARLFVVPGMNHCAGGPATDRFDVLTAMLAWVEKDQAPDGIPASVNPNNAERPPSWRKDRSRPLCAYPTVAHYNGKGDIENVGSFTCK